MKKNQIHLYNFEWILKSRGPMEKESLSLYIYERLKGAYESWTDLKYCDNPDIKLLLGVLKKNLLEETSIAWDNFIKEFNIEIDYNQDFSEEFKDEVNWDNISYTQILPEEFIKEFKDKVDWSALSCYQKLSEKFIREFKDKVDWPKVSWHQKLSEKFIREFKDKVDWGGISKNQILSEEFIREFQNKLNRN